MKFGSLFAGVGGFDMGVEAAGWECCWQVEWNPDCQQTLAYHWPDVPRWGDVAEVKGYELPPVDAVIFGSPCQDLSIGGKQQGLDGTRSSLFFEATRIIREMRDATGGTFPRWVVWENVAGALSSRRGDDFETVLREMADLGAGVVEWAVLDAQFFGVPQRRRRVFAVACLDPATAARCPGQILPVTQGRRKHGSAVSSTRQAVAGNAEAGVAQYVEWWNGDMIADTLTRTSNEQRMPDKNRFQAVVHTDTMTVRRLTPIECERLMGWPDDHTLCRADGKKNGETVRYNMCGNGVASPVAQWIAERINDADRNL